MLIFGLLQINPTIGYGLTYFLPFFTIIIFARTHYRGVLIYAFSSIFLIFILLPSPLEMILFFALPSLLLGLAYGYALESHASTFEMIFLLAMVQMVVLFITRWISLWLYEVDLLALFYEFFRVANLSQIEIFNPLILYTISLIQVLVSYILLLPLIERMGFKLDYQVFYNHTTLKIFLGMFILSLGLSVIQPRLAFYVIGPLALISVYTYVYFFMKPLHYEPYIMLVGLVIYPYFNALVAPLFIGPFRILTSLFLTFIPLVLAYIKSFTQKRKNALI
jgi:hypothetical protein